MTAATHREPGAGCRVLDSSTDLELNLRVCEPLCAGAAHDLKNALTGLMLWCDTLQTLKPRLAAGAHDQTSALYRTVLEQINTLAGRSLHIVDDLLDLSRLEAGYSLPLAAVKTDLVKLVGQVVQSQPASVRNGRLRVESSESELWGSWDADRIGRVVQNLVSNAVKYSDANEPISVRVSMEASQDDPVAVLQVEDGGVGIPADQLASVFEAFHRADNVASSIPGTGLGLWVSHMIVAQHGGALTLVSREGEGTIVTVRLPLAPAVVDLPLESGGEVELAALSAR